MAKSSEYPDLEFVKPRAWGSGRDGKAVRYIVVHYTAGAERSTSAEDGAAYDARRTDGTSTHYFVDSNSVVQCVLTKDRANAARTKGNRLGIQYELCGTVQTRAQWLDAASLATLRNAARQIARDCRKYGIPVRRLSVAETRAAWYDYPNGPKGIVGHVDCTYAYPEDGGDHTDPGAQFPWDVLLELVQEEMEGDDMTPAEMTAWAKSAEGRLALANAIGRTDGVFATPAGTTNADGTPNEFWGLDTYVRNIYTATISARQYAADALAVAKALAERDDVDEVALAGALATPLAAALAPLLPEDREVDADTLAEAFRDLLSGGQA